MNETQEEPCQRRGDIKSTYDFPAEHEYQRVSSARSREIRSPETDYYEELPITKASEQLPLPTSATTEAYENIVCSGSSNQCQMSTLATTHGYGYLATYGVKQPTMPIPRNRGLATSDIQAKEDARPRETTI